MIKEIRDVYPIHIRETAIDIKMKGWLAKNTGGCATDFVWGLDRDAFFYLSLGFFLPNDLILVILS